MMLRRWVVVCLMSASLVPRSPSDLVAVIVYQQRSTPASARFAAMVTHFTTAAELSFAACSEHISWKAQKSRTAIHREAWNDRVSSPSGHR
jgi:hypothetical protein